MNDIWQPPTLEDLREIYVAQGIVGVQAAYRRLLREYSELAKHWTRLKGVAKRMDAMIKAPASGEE